MGILNKKKITKILLVLLGIYVLQIVISESLMGFYQPERGNTMLITTFEEDGQALDRVVARLEKDGEIFVAVNHWPRAWARRLQRNSDVQISYKGITSDYSAVVLTGDEHEQGKMDFSVPFSYKFMTGFPPRYFVRLDPKVRSD